MCTFRIHNFKSCCGFLSLRTGCFLIAVAQLLMLLIADFVADSEHPIVIVGNLVVLIFIGYLIYGTLNENHTHLRWWMIINNSFTVILAATFGFCLFGMLLITQQSHEGSDRRRLGGYMTIMLLLTIGAIAGLISTIQGIFSWVAYSYICELREQEDRKNATEKSFERSEMHSLVPI